MLRKAGLNEQRYHKPRGAGKGAWEIGIHKLRFEDIQKMGKTVFPSIKQAEKAIEIAEKRGIKCEKELL